MTAMLQTRKPLNELFRNAGFARVFAAGLASALGSSISGICLIWIIWISTGDPFDVAYLAISSVIAGIVFSVFTGTLVDRYNRKTLMITSDLVRALALLTVFMFIEFSTFNLFIVLGMNFVVKAFNTVFRPSEHAIMPTLVKADMLSTANGLVRSGRQAVSFIGTSAGGIFIITTGAIQGIGVNAITFIVSAVLLLGLSHSHSKQEFSGSKGVIKAYFSDIRSGFTWLYRAKGLLQMTFSAMAFNFCITVIDTFLVIYATTVLNGSGFIFASMLSAEVAGTILGSLLVARLRSERWAGIAWTVPYGIFAGSIILIMVLVSNVPVAIICMFTLGIMGGFAGTSWLTATQLLVPGHMQGRFFGIDAMGAMAIIPLAQFEGAVLIGSIGIQNAYIVAASLWIILGAIFIIPKATRRIGYPPSSEDAGIYSQDRLDGHGQQTPNLR